MGRSRAASTRERSFVEMIRYLRLRTTHRMVWPEHISEIEDIHKRHVSETKLAVTNLSALLRCVTTTQTWKTQHFSQEKTHPAQRASLPQ